KLAQAKKFVFDGLASGQLKPEIDKVFAFDEMAEAHRYMESNAQIGKDFGKGLIVFKVNMPSEK
ncbi:zinc-binding dehydrogenase, partial [Haemophilus influenzae]